MGEEEEGNFAAIWEKAARISGIPYLPLPAQTQILKQLRKSRNTPRECGDGGPRSHFTSAGPGAGLGCEEDTEGLGAAQGAAARACVLQKAGRSQEKCSEKGEEEPGKTPVSPAQARPGEPEPCLPLSRGRPP